MSVEEIIALSIVGAPEPGLARWQAGITLAALDAAGYVVVPKEPTDEMISAAIRVPREAYWPGHRSPAYYHAMISSRPKP